MSLGDDIRSDVDKLVGTPWSVRNGTVVPDTDGVQLYSNDAVKLDAVYLYADLLGSTALARDYTWQTAGKVIRASLHTASKIIKEYKGEIRSYDGDRVMGIFIGGSKNSNAAKAALRINYALGNIVQPALYSSLPTLKSGGYQPRMCVGIASGEAVIARAGVRGRSDLVSIGRAPNVAAKLSDIRETGNYRTYITGDVYKRLDEASKLSKGVNMWEARITTVGGEQMTIYRSTYWWSF
ncbi:guanylate cyclase [Streptomyces rubiginosohelvolus]|uniref:adenylate/guanylate cyclase domain-containing protein n=1 Tax=Streptomyces rubiginosohelvolus TaxID=67362 RepID=UPI00167937DF|nr:adenylate/guanylate cyclase domain-containing protein [Streptomyces rubiginosohelvolus]GGS23897.1 guanylate cyclase [Streptomyces rubiginosohelvolus]